MTLAFLIYAVSLLPSLIVFFVIAVGVLAFFALMIVVFNDHENTYRGRGEAKKPLPYNTLKKITAGIIFSALTVTLLPSEKTAWLMLGGYTAQTVYESAEGQKYKKLIMKKIDEVIGGKIDEATK